MTANPDAQGMLELADKTEAWPNAHLQPEENRIVTAALRAASAPVQTVNERVLSIIQMTPSDQFNLAFKVAENIGYVLGKGLTFEPPVETYVRDYEFRGDGGDYTPTDNERAMIEDAIEGYLAAASAPVQVEYENEEYNPAYDEGITFAIVQLAELTGSKDWQMRDGSEDHDTDVRDTIMDVLKRAGLYDEETGNFAAAQSEDYNSEAIRAAGKRLVEKQFPASAQDGVRADDKLRLFLSILAAAGGETSGNDDTWNWINYFCDDVDPLDTFNQASKRKLTRVTHDSDTDNSIVYLTDAGRAFIAALPEHDGSAVTRPEGK